MTKPSDPNTSTITPRKQLLGEITNPVTGRRVGEQTAEQLKQHPVLGEMVPTPFTDTYRQGYLPNSPQNTPIDSDILDTETVSTTTVTFSTISASNSARVTTSSEPKLISAPRKRTASPPSKKPWVSPLPGYGTAYKKDVTPNITDPRATKPQKKPSELKIGKHEVTLGDTRKLAVGGDDEMGKSVKSLSKSHKEPFLPGRPTTSTWEEFALRKKNSDEKIQQRP